MSRSKFEHDLYDRDDDLYDRDDDLYDRDDDLSHCKICGGAEGSLPTLCPGRRMTAYEEESVYAGYLNFASGPMSGAQWWTPAPHNVE